MKYTAFNECCLESMSRIPDRSVDMVLADLPQGITRNHWDVIIPFDKLWAQYERVVKPNGAIVLFANGKFTAMLMMSNLKMHRYNLIWQKTSATGHLNAKIQPLRDHEDICVFYKNQCVYNPQKTTGHKRKVSTAGHKMNSKKTENYGSFGLSSYDSTERYPKSVWKFKSDKQKSAVHATQKPIDLLKELILTYSNEGDLVLDNTAGSFGTGIACFETKRDCILIEKDTVQFNNGLKRLQEHIEN